MGPPAAEGTTLGRAHVLWGLAIVVLFLGTGVYMRGLHLRGFPDRVHYLYRASHVYLLFSGLLNLLAGAHLRNAQRGWRALVQTAGSLLVLLVPAVLFWAFVVEPPLGIPSRSRTLAAAIFALSGTLLLLLSDLPERGRFTGAGNS
jgi:hypothetical protein